MKKQIFTIGIVTLLLIFSSENTFAQRDAGGSSGGGVTPQVCPTDFVRNNGDGTCGGNAQIRLFFNQAPEFAPELISIIYNGENLLTNPMPVSGNIADLATKGYIGYCLPLANIPPAVKLTVVFRYAGTGQEDCVLTGTN
jgi:hypothetical protein